MAPSIFADVDAPTPAPAEAVASAARAGLAPSPVIGVHLTPYAPGCSDLHINDRRRWRDFWGKSPEGALRSTLRRLRRGPMDVRAEREANGDVGLYGEPVRNHGALFAEADGSVPLAFIHTGLSVDQAEAALLALRNRGWDPSDLQEIAE